MFQTRSQTWCIEQELSKECVPVIKVTLIYRARTYTRVGFRKVGISIHEAYFISWNPLSRTVLLCTSRSPPFLELTLLYVLASHIKVTLFPRTHYLICSCSIHQGYLLSWNLLSQFILAPCIKVTFLPGTHSPVNSCCVHQGKKLT